MTGRHIAIPLLAALLALPARAEPLPPSFDWRDNGGDWLTPIREQGDLCQADFAFAAIAAVEFTLNRAAGDPDRDPDLSEQILLSCSSSGDCSGGSASDALDWLLTDGTVEEGCLPYAADDTKPCADACASWPADAWKITGHGDGGGDLSTDALRARLIAEGPLVVGLDVYTDLLTHPGGVYSHATGVLEGQAAMLLVGFDDVEGAWIARSSWGADWGEAGWLRIRYEDSGIQSYFALSVIGAAEPGCTCADGDGDGHFPEACADTRCFPRDDCDDLDARGWALFFRDDDGDGYGQDSESLCLDAATPPYTALLAGDCDDTRRAVNPAAPEVCGNAIDDDCNGVAEEEDATGCTVYYRDDDGDGYGQGTDVRCLCAGEDPHDAPLPGDCDETRFDRNPGATELCDGTDNDCDGEADEPGTLGCTVYWRDGDDDTYGVEGDTLCLCAPTDPYDAARAGDCDDGAAAVHPAASEICNAGIDDDCDGEADQPDTTGCTQLFRDGDGDGHGVAGDAQCLCQPVAPYLALLDDDCDDDDARVNTDAIEICGDGTDNDCSGVADEPGSAGCVEYFRDDDRDGYGVSGDMRCLCAAAAPHDATRDGDCDDDEPTVNPGVAEVCDGVDNDCSGAADEGFDLDGDGHTTCAGDCDDSNGSIFPDADETCDGADNDCDGQTDEDDALGCTRYYHDADGDGYGATGPPACKCAPAAPHTARRAGDCDDTRFTVQPEAIEVCDGTDNDCDGQIDEGFDRDGDGITACAGDCDDGDAAVNSGAEEICDGLDNDCDGWIDEGFDEDGDGFATCAGDCDDGTAARSPVVPEVCDGLDNDCDGRTDEGFDVDGDGQTTCAGDCNDRDAAVNGGAEEICDGLDNDCDGQIDEGFDADEDGYTTCAGDCDDQSTAVNPDAIEICDGLDNDCDGQFDEAGAADAGTWHADADGDGYGDPEVVSIGCAAPEGYIDDDRDCSDRDAEVHPGASEICNGIDDDCDPLTNELIDGDGDGASTCDGDCDDGNAAIHPGASEICNGIDDDCNPLTDELIDGDGDGASTCDGDCDDGNAAVHPGASEICNGIDDDCDGRTDDVDADEDGVLAAACGGDDCDDGNAAIHPGAIEICDDGQDNDCNGRADAWDESCGGGDRPERGEPELGWGCGISSGRGSALALALLLAVPALSASRARRRRP